MTFKGPIIDYDLRKFVPAEVKTGRKFDLTSSFQKGFIKLEHCNLMNRPCFLIFGD